MEGQRPHHTCEIQRRLSKASAQRRCRPPDFGKKMIRAAHAKEKQLLENSRNRPNRLNLLDSTVCSSVRSNFFTKNSCLVRFPVFRSLKEATHTRSESEDCPQKRSSFYRRSPCTTVATRAASSRTS